MISRVAAAHVAYPERSLTACSTCEVPETSEIWNLFLAQQTKED
jgi:hypothetical protein